MYQIVYEDELFWVSKDGKIIESIGGFIDPITPEIIIEEIKNEI